MSAYLTLPDTITVEQETAAPAGVHSGRPLGRGTKTTYVVKAQLETSKDKISAKDGARTTESTAEVVFDRRLLRRAGYVPRHGDHVIAIKNYETGVTDDVDLWLSDPKNDGAGALLRCTMMDRSPQR